MLDYLVGQRTNSRGCPVDDPATEANIAGANIAGANRTTTLLDALTIAQCASGVDNPYCP